MLASVRCSIPLVVIRQNSQCCLVVTGLALSAPFYTVPAASVFAIAKSFSTKSHTTKEDKLSAKDRLTLFKAAHQTTGAIAIPVAIISAALFGVAGYTIPVRYRRKLVSVLV